MEAKRLIRLFLLGTVLFVKTSLAQVTQPTVGSKFDYRFSNLLNYPSKTATVADFEGRILILYFWNSACAGCIAGWPELLRLQAVFDSGIQIVLVNQLQDERTVNKIIDFQRRANGLEMDLPMTCGDTVLGNLFPYPGVPRIVWIDQSGRFQSFTDGSYLNEEIIRRILAKEPVSMFQLPIDLGDNVHYNYGRSKLKDFKSPFFLDGNGKVSQYMPLLSQSVLTGKIDGLTPVLAHLSLNRETNYRTLTMQGAIERFYRIAYNDVNFDSGNRSYTLWPLPKSRVFSDVSNQHIYTASESGETNYDFYYCYQLTTKSPSRKRLQRMLQLDLDRLFGLEAFLETREIECLVLKSTDTTLMVKAINRANLREDGVYPPHSVREFIRYLSTSQYFYDSPYPIIDETGYRGKVGGFRLSSDYKDLNEELLKCGLSITLETRPIEVLVLREPRVDSFPPDLILQKAFGKNDWKYDVE